MTKLSHLLYTPSTTANTDGENETFQIIHPFHPLFEREFKLATYRHNWGESLAYFHDDNGNLRSVPVMTCRTNGGVAELLLALMRPDGRFQL